MAKKLSNNFFERLFPFLIVFIIVLAGVVGYLFNEVNNLKKTRVANVTTSIEETNNSPPEMVSGKLSEEQAKKLPSISDDDHIRGSRDAEVFLVEYSDLECPFCKRFHPTAQQAVDEYKGRVAWVYRHFPLDSIHSKARAEAIATECAAELGGNDSFWDLVDKIFEVTPSNNGLDLATLPTLAAQIGLNESFFKACLDEERYKDRVEEDYQGGLKAGVTGTPGNFVVNKKGEVWFVPGAVPFENLKPIIDEALGN